MPAIWFMTFIWPRSLLIRGLRSAGGCCLFTHTDSRVQLVVFAVQPWDDWWHLWLTRWRGMSACRRRTVMYFNVTYHLIWECVLVLKVACNYPLHSSLTPSALDAQLQLLRCHTAVETLDPMYMDTCLQKNLVRLADHFSSLHSGIYFHGFYLLFSSSV